MNNTLQDKLVVAISSTALFDLRESNKIFIEQGEAAYSAHQKEHEEEVLLPGAAFNIVKKLLALNKRDEKACIEVVLVSRNSADTGLRVFHSIKAHDLDITRAVFTSGRSPYEYLHAFSSNLFLSTHEGDVLNTLQQGIPAAKILPGVVSGDAVDDVIRVAFDGDAVIFSDEAEKIFKANDITVFSQHELQYAHQPLQGGPLIGFLRALHHLQEIFAEDSDGKSLIRTALVTARGAPAHERAIRTLRSWNIHINEAVFLGGLSKGEFLRSFGADIFFDDTMTHCCSANESQVVAAHVPYEE